MCTRRLLVLFAASCLAVLAAGCGHVRPSQVDGTPRRLVVVKSVKLPESKPAFVNQAHHAFIDFRHPETGGWYRCEKGEGGVYLFEISDEDAFRDDRYWGRDVWVLEVFTEERAARIVDRIPEVVAAYEDEYDPWPGPNSNTFIAHLCREIPELDVTFHHNSIGKDYAEILRAGPSTTGTGLHLDTLPLGIQIGIEDGVEVHFLQLTFGISLFPPAIKLPFLPRLGFSHGPPSSTLKDEDAVETPDVSDEPDATLEIDRD